MDKKVAVITGASKGVGKNIALYLAKKGYITLLISRSESNLNKLFTLINNEGGYAKYYPLDISNNKDVAITIKNIIKEFKKIDLLFNSAGVLHKGLLETSKDNIDKMIRINLLGTIYITNKIAQHMKDNKKGYIINMSSMSGKIAYPMFGSYAASKFGVSGYNEALFKELTEYGVKVTAICPALIATDMTENFFDKDSLSKMINIENIVKTVDYLLSLDSTAVIKEIAINGTY
ncbi:MAG TPA: SDR family oxidoreductase [Victivallales bacterium]|nr:SDR family oxidoreductase [Victivallales bacterium]